MIPRFEKLERAIVGRHEAQYIQPRHLSAKKEREAQEAEFTEAITELTHRAQEFSSNKEFWDRLLALIEGAKTAWADGKKIIAQQYLTEATVLVNRAIGSQALQGVRVRLAFVPLVWCVLLFLFQQLVLWLEATFRGFILISPEYYEYIWWGLLGGSTAVLWGIVKHGSDMTFDPAYVIWYLFKPVLGAIMGVVAVILLQTGFLAIQGEGEIRNKAPLVILAFLAGFSERFFIRLLDKVITSVLGGNGESGSQGSPGPKKTDAQLLAAKAEQVSATTKKKESRS